MNRPISGFHQDSESQWVADLTCGHASPFTERAWILTPERRESRIGTALECLQCDRSQIPEGHEAYRRTPSFTEESTPRALLARHSTKRGVWALIHVSSGRLDYFVHAPFDRHEVLTAAAPGVVLPEVEHHVAASGPVEFSVEFWRGRLERRS